MASHCLAVKATLKATGDTTTRHDDGDGRLDNGKGQHGDGRHDDGNGRHADTDESNSNMLTAMCSRTTYDTMTAMSIFPVILKFDSTKLTISKSQLWVLLVITTKNHGQPFIQYAEHH